jgi:hypothetical protein
MGVAWLKSRKFQLWGKGLAGGAFVATSVSGSVLALRRDGVGLLLLCGAGFALFLLLILGYSLPRAVARGEIGTSPHPTNLEAMVGTTVLAVFGMVLLFRCLSYFRAGDWGAAGSFAFALGIDLAFESAGFLSFLTRSSPTTDSTPSHQDTE